MVFARALALGNPWDFARWGQPATAPGTRGASTVGDPRGRDNHPAGEDIAQH